MVFLTKSIHASSHDGFFTTSANCTRSSVVVSFTVWFAILFIEGLSVEWSSTIGACKALLMPLLIEGVDDSSRCDLLATCATCSKCVVETILTVWHSVLFEKAAALE